MPPLRYSSSTSIRIGVLFAPAPIQLLDVAAVDLFHMLSKDYLGAIPILPQPIRDLAIPVEIYWIVDQDDPMSTAFSVTQPGSSKGPPTTITIAPMTSNLSIRTTHNLTSREVAPGQLTILMLPGPDPMSNPSQALRTFIRGHAECGQTDIITICTGIYPACHSGICDGHKVTGPRGLLPDLKRKFKGVGSWEDKRWSRSLLHGSTVESKDDQRPAELWTAAGITNGNDCVAAYIKAHFNVELADIVCRMADVGDRPREYETSQMVEGMWWVSRILRAVFKGFWRQS